MDIGDGFVDDDVGPGFYGAKQVLLGSLRGVRGHQNCSKNIGRVCTSSWTPN